MYQSQDEQIDIGMKCLKLQIEAIDKFVNELREEYFYDSREFIDE